MPSPDIFYPTTINMLFLGRRRACFVRGTPFPATSGGHACANREGSTAAHGASTHRLDGAGADGSAVGADGVGPGPSNYHVGD